MNTTPVATTLMVMINASHSVMTVALSDEPGMSVWLTATLEGSHMPLFHRLSEYLAQAHTGRQRGEEQRALVPVTLQCRQARHCEPEIRLTIPERHVHVVVHPDSRRSTGHSMLFHLLQSKLAPDGRWSVI